MSQFTASSNYTNLLNQQFPAYGQVAFPATQVPSADANTLDDYEEGTFTPNVGGTATYTTQVGHYTKIGRLVHIDGEIAINVLGTGSTTTISGLPFSAAVAAGGGVMYFTSLAVSVTCLMCRVSTATIVFASTAAAVASVTNTPAIFGNGAQVQTSITYRV